MRIAVNTRFLLPDRLEGLGWYTHELLRRMVAAHPEDEFIFFFDRPFDPAFVYGSNVTPVVLFPPARHPVLWYIWFEWSVARALRKFAPDVFFSPDSYLSLRGSTPSLMTVHDLIPLQHPEQVPWWSRDYYRYFFPRFMRRAERLVAVSGFTRQAIVELAGIAPEKISVVYNGCREGFVPMAENEKQALRDQFSGGQPYFFYTGAIHPRKNIHRLIQAFDRFKQRSGAPAKLLLAGRFAWQTGAVTEAYEQAQFKADIRFLGYIPESDLTRLMASALALTYISLNEGFGMPMLEAMHAETPVLAARATCLPEVAADAALYVDPLSIPDIAGSLERLYLDEALRADLIAKGRVRRAHFNWDTAAEQLYALLQALSGRGQHIEPEKHG